MLAAYLAESALWSFLTSFKNSSNEDVSGMVRHFGKESRFHRLNLLGWAKSLDDQEKDEMKRALSQRLPLASVATKNPLLSGAQYAIVNGGSIPLLLYCGRFGKFAWLVLVLNC